jgi:hypothetical protein
MTECRHQWKMINIEFGFVGFEKCSHCNDLRTYFSAEDTTILRDVYREEGCTWHRVENAQSFRFDLHCQECDHTESFKNLMGLLYCTGCMAECEIETQRKILEAQKTWVLVAFGHLPREKTSSIPQPKLDILTDYFNQRRDTSRSTIKILSFDMIEDFTLCKGEFIHDIGMLSPEPPTKRKFLF